MCGIVALEFHNDSVKLSYFMEHDCNRSNERGVLFCFLHRCECESFELSPFDMAYL